MIIRLSVTMIMFIGLTFSNCKTKKQDTALADLGVPELIFGSSGGFAGKTVKFKLLEDGQLFEKAQQSDTFQPAGSFDADLAGQFFLNYKNLGFHELSLNDPGNMTYFITIKQGDRKKKLAWGGMNKEVPEVLETYYKNFMKLTKHYNKTTK